MGSGQLEGLDHSAYAAELCAARIALTAIVKAQVPTTLIIDNLAVQRQIQEGIGGCRRLPSYFSTAWREVYEQLDQCHDLLCFWVPAHGRHEDWRAPPGSNTEQWREANAAADEEAAAQAKELWERLQPGRTTADACDLQAHFALQRVLEGAEELRQAFTEAMGEEPADADN